MGRKNYCLGLGRVPTLTQLGKALAAVPAKSDTLSTDQLPKTMTNINQTSVPQVRPPVATKRKNRCHTGPSPATAAENIQSLTANLFKIITPMVTPLI